MLKKIFTTVIITLTAALAFAQGDDCLNATDIGALPSPIACPDGSGTTFTYNGTTNGATAENPYSSLACMDAPAADVWIQFEASGNDMNLDFTSNMNGANIGVYSGTGCNNLTGLFCENSNNGNISTTISPLNPGETYFVQISGEDETDVGDFTLDLTNFDNCDLCVLNSNLTVTPAPTNGYYLPGETVQFCLEITDFEQVSANWIHSIVPSFGASWDTGSITPISSPTAGTGYNWIWTNGPNGPGWYVDDGDGNVTNNFGDPDIDGTGSWTFCWEITVSNNCTANGDLSSSINTTSDGETGSWSSTACTGDPDVPFQAAMICCGVPDVSFTDESCPGASDGTFSATGIDGIAPYDYVFENSAGTVVYTENNVPDGVASTATGLPADTYTVTVTDDNGCEQLVDVTIDVPPCSTPTFDPEPADVTVQCLGDVPAMTTLDWTDMCDGIGSVTGTDVSDGNTCPEVITRTWEYTNSCGNTATVSQIITVNDDIDPAGTAPADVTVQCIGDVPAADINDVTGVSDNCTTNPTVTHVGDVSDGNTCPEEITRTYRVEDDCGNFIDVDQIITVNDDTAPTASNPATTTVQCASDVPATDPTVVTDEADNCTANPTVTFLSETSDNNVCDGEELTRVYEIADDCGNTTTVTHTIIIDAYTPTFTLAGTNPTSCQAMDGSIAINGLNPNTDYQINYNSGSTFIFNTDINGDYVISGLGAGVYTNFIISSTICLSCASSDNTVIELVGPNSPAVNAGEDVEICEGEDLTLTAQNPDGANISWDQGVSDGVSFTPNVSTEIYTVTANLGGCISTDDIEVIIHPLPSLDAGTDVSICEGESVTLSASGANNYSWDNGVADDVSFSPNTTTIYTVTGTSQEGCTTSDEVEVTVHSNPDVNIQADKTDGCLPLKVQFENNSSNADECVYTISDGTELTDCAATHTFYEPGCYDIDFKVTNTNGCTNSVAIEDYICVENLPQADFSFNPKELTTLKPTANFYNQSTDAIHYEWIFNNNTTSTNEDPVHTFLAIEDTYQVTLLAFGENGCADSITREVPLIEELLFYIPNTFTPDGNALNQTFKPVFTSGFDPYEYELLIFNRWGEIVFESNNSEAGWDGTYGVSSNKIVKSGTYVWKIFFKTKYDDEQKTEIGHVNLLK